MGFYCIIIDNSLFKQQKKFYIYVNQPDDKVIEPFFDIGYTYSESNWGLDMVFYGGTGGGSFIWEKIIIYKICLNKHYIFLSKY